MRRSAKWVAWAALLGLALYAAVYVYALNSDGYKFARKWLTESATLQSTVGDISSLRLSPWYGYGERFAGDKKRVRLVVDVMGTRQSVSVKLALEKDGETWRVVQFETMD